METGETLSKSESNQSYKLVLETKLLLLVVSSPDAILSAILFFIETPFFLLLSGFDNRRLLSLIVNPCLVPPHCSPAIS